MDGRQLLMAFDKIIDSAQLESDLTSVAAAIRAKGAAADPLSFPAGFVSAVNNISTSSAFGYIVASFPTTAASCTCSNRGTVLEADAAGLARGQFVFKVPAAGTWTVTISNGTDTKSKSVSISAAGQAEVVKLSFSLILLDGGDECTDITGGWAKLIDTTATIVNTGSALVLTAQSGNRCYCYTVNKIDVSGRKTLKMHIAENPNDIASVTMGLKNTKSDTAWIAKKLIGKGYTGDTELDISSVTSGEYWVGVSVASAGYPLVLDEVELI